MLTGVQAGRQSRGQTLLPGRFPVSGLQSRGRWYQKQPASWCGLFGALLFGSWFPGCGDLGINLPHGFLIKPFLLGFLPQLGNEPLQFCEVLGAQGISK